MQRTNEVALMQKPRRKGSRVSTLVVAIVFSLLSVLSNGQSFGEKPFTISPQLSSLLSDDYESDSRNQYEVTGQVDWKDGSLLINESASVVWNKESGPWSEISLDLEFPVYKAGETTEFRIYLGLDECTSSFVQLQQSDSGDNIQSSVRVFDTDQFWDSHTKTSSIGQGLEFSEVLPSGIWKLEYRNGLWRVRSPDGGIAYAYIETNYSAGVRVVVLDSIHGDLILKQMDIVGSEEQRPAQFRSEFEEGNIEHDRLTDQVRIYRYDQETLVPQTRGGLSSSHYRRLALEETAKGEIESALVSFDGFTVEWLERFGREHPVFANNLNDIGVLNAFAGNYPEAKKYYQESLAIRKRVLGTEHPDYAASLNNLGSLLSYLYQYDDAKQLLLSALTIRQKVLGKNHPDCASNLDNLSSVFVSLGEYEEAELCLNQSLEIFNYLHGHESFASVGAIVNLARLHHRSNDFERAEAEYRKALEIVRKKKGELHPEYAMIANNLGALLIETKDFETAENQIATSLRILETQVGQTHPSHAVASANLAKLYKLSGRFDAATVLFEQGLTTTRKQLSQTAYVLSERQQLELNQMTRYRLDNYLACCLKQADLPKNAVEQVVLWKGETLVRQRELRLAADDPAIAGQFAELQRISQQLYALTKATSEPDAEESWRERVAKITAYKERLERDLMQSSAAFRDAVEDASLDSIQQSIPSDAILVDFLEYRDDKELRLLASVIRSTGDPMMLDLGLAQQAGEAIDVWRNTFGMSSQAKAAGLALRKQLWEPLLEHIGDAKTILISPDGVLGKLPFAALPGKETDSYLIEDHRIAMIPVPQLLPALVNEEGKKVLKRDLLLIGGVDYDTDLNSPVSEVEAVPPARRKRPFERDGDSASYASLAYSAPEVEAIGGLYRRLFTPGPDAIVDLRAEFATEAAFRKSAPECMYLHVATHGFFSPPEFKSALSPDLIAAAESRAASRGMDQQQRDIVQGYSPGQLSGLVFAGANRDQTVSDDPSADQDDGIMTADEIAFLPLSGVRLAVLSACQTGLGDSAGGEGLLGVQRAFQVAGVDSSIATLWSINDPATSRLMQEFYINFLEKNMSILDAMREAQLWALNNPDAVPRAGLNTAQTDTTDRLPPYYWAPFVLSGDWR